MELEVFGVGTHELYGKRLGLRATTRLDRRDFGVAAQTMPEADHRPTELCDTVPPMDDVGVLLGNRLDVTVIVEAMLEGSGPEGHA
jgi:hypothetical protein